jgi:Rieske Fe-S protein
MYMTKPTNPSGPPVAVKREDEPPPTRRSFFTAAAAVVTGTIAVLTPLGVGVAAFLSPLFRKSQSPKVQIALLDQVPDDGQPRVFPVIAPREDAWTRYPAQRIGAVYLIRNKGEAKPTAFTAKCPHAGCFIGYSAGDKLFKCPCHTSTFKLDGTRLRGDAEVAPRGMDPLPVEIRQEAAKDGKQLASVWVEFVDYRTGIADRIPTT